MWVKKCQPAENGSIAKDSNKVLNIAASLELLSSNSCNPLQYLLGTLRVEFAEKLALSTLSNATYPILSYL
jgi:hypothetical protein